MLNTVDAEKALSIHVLDLDTPAQPWAKKLFLYGFLFFPCWIWRVYRALLHPLLQRPTAPPRPRSRSRSHAVFAEIEWEERMHNRVWAGYSLLALWVLAVMAGGATMAIKFSNHLDQYALIASA